MTQFAPLLCLYDLRLNNIARPFSHIFLTPHKHTTHGGHMRKKFSITHIIFYITYIVFPIHLWGTVGGGVCEKIQDSNSCTEVAGCYWNYNGQTGSCIRCPEGYYCTNKDRHSCNISGYVQTGGVDMLEINSWGTGLESKEECETNTTATLYCPASHYFGQSGTQYKCIPCTAKMEDGTIQTSKVEDNISNKKDTITQLLTNYGRAKRCITCGKNAEPDDDGIGCVCPDGYQFTGKSETQVYDNTQCEQKSIIITCNPGYYVKSGKCEQCPVGTYQAMNNFTGTECTLCDIGYSNALPGQETCDVCPAGTYQDKTGQSSCKPCPTGKYQNEQGQSSCKSCINDIVKLTNTDKNCSLTAINVTDKTSLDNCEYTLTSAQGYYLTRGANVGEYYHFTCNQCPNLTTIDAKTITGNRTVLYDEVGTMADGHACSTNCSCDGKNNKEGACINNAGAYRCECIEGYHVKDETRDTISYNPINGQKDCEINKYYIRYYCNSDDSSPTKEIEIEYGGEHYILPSNTCQKTGYTFNGWLEENSNTTYTNETSLIVDQDYVFKAQWAVKEFKVNYSGNENTAGNAPSEPTTCTYDKPCNAPDNTYMRAGYIFANKWSCQYMPQAGQKLQPCCKTINSMGFDTGTCEISPGTDISTISGGNDILLSAIWTTCQAGYYCPGTNSDPKTEQKKCPAGSTTAEGATYITDCHMVGGTTQICDTNGCFTLPNTAGNIFYQGASQ